MWRYYELLTDLPAKEIAFQREQVKAGKAHPMKVKQNLARLIVTDFHSADAAERAAADWSKQFQKVETPEAVEEIRVAYAEVAGRDGGSIKLDKLVARCGMADSASDAQRKIKQGAVRVDGEVKKEPVLAVKVPAELTLRVGRLIKKVAIS
jgi:tyrosyl-tRNA synthetase